MIKNLNEKELGHSFFYSLKINDLQHAYQVLKLGVSINTSYFIQQNQIMYTINLVVGKVAETVKKYGLPHAKAQLGIRILDKCLEQKPDIRCHCIQKNPHYCALSQAFKYIEFQQQSDLFRDGSLIVLKLLYNGGTYKNLHNSNHYKWNGINILNNYVIAKNDQLIQLLRIGNVQKYKIQQLNRHIKCALRYQISPCKL